MQNYLQQSRMEFPFSPLNLFREFKKPKSLKIKDIANVYGKWWGVTKKQDGLLVAMHYSGFNLVNVYQYNGKYVDTIPCATQFKEILFAELVDETYILFDCTLKANLKQRLKFLNSLAFKNNVTINRFTFTKNPFEVKLNYALDEGIIMTSVYDKRSPVFKFKQMNTVDFYIKDNQCYCMISKDQYHKLSDELRDETDLVSNYFPFKFKINSTFCQNVDHVVDNAVVECYFDVEGRVWKMFRPRPDKTFEFETQKTGPNNWFTALEHYHLFCKPLTIDYITNWIAENCDSIKPKH